MLVRQGCYRHQLLGSTRLPIHHASHVVPCAVRSHHIVAVFRTPPGPPFQTCKFGTLTGSAVDSHLRGSHEVVPHSTVATASVPLLVYVLEQQLVCVWGHAWDLQ